MRLFFLLLIMLSMSIATAQQNKVGLKLGVIDPNSFGEFGYNIEFSLERSLKKVENLTFGVQLGVGKKNTFPDYFNRTFMFAEENDVAAEIDARIRDLSFQEVIDFNFSSYDVNYLRLFAKYKVLGILGWDVKVFSGVLLRDQATVDFDIYQFSFDNNNQLVDYRSQYRVQHDLVLAWPMGVELEKEISRNLSFTLDALYDIPFNRKQGVDFYVLALGRVGINYMF